MPEKTAIKSKSEITQTSRAASSPPARVPKTKEKNLFQTATLTTSDIQNHSRYEGKSFGIRSGRQRRFNQRAGIGRRGSGRTRHRHRWLYGKGDGGSLSAEEKETVSAITRMLGTTAGAAVGNSAADAVRSGMAADGAVGNNFETIFTPQQGTEEKRTGKNK